ncbi:ABC transporter ATP-binding protein [Alkalihalobacillus pseudalcaliphilus]|uniref:ABC transporter ATP-binding protein n=1 Tax=Alkalihalobacillus pseudalcaliphilus TaxID=79884 RepID=UPI00064DB365|nr:ABC transporter ATP-binding protein [Alkalihalobacillus pseudalcaliphilus]KMK77923.1 antibiotic ABC transporter ATP-binding protein [Alkalihalobacillus pseudalcaliphilus]
MMVASLTGIVKRYGKKLVLDYTDLDIRQGEILGLLGPNGAGKTTLIKCLTGMENVDQGTIELFDDQKNPFHTRNKERIGLVTQEISVFVELTAKENINFFAGIYGLKGEKRKQRVQEALEFVGLTEHAKERAAKFSGGMLRRLNIACSIVHEPKLLIMDEPTVGIDPQSRNHILEAVKKLNQRGTTILYTTHYMEEVEAIASEVVIIDQGQVMTRGTVQELVRNIQHEEKIKIEVSHPEMISLDQIEKLVDVKQVTKIGNEIVVIAIAGSGHLDRILSIIKEGSGIISMNVEKPDLEDVFLTLTGRTLRDGGEK